MPDIASVDDVQDVLTLLKSWILTQPHLPHYLDDALLTRFLHSCYYDLDKSKATIEAFVKIRAAASQLFTKRDPTAPELQKAISITNLAHIHISGNRILWIWQLNDPGLNYFDHLHDAKLRFLFTDSWLLNEPILETSDIVIVDIKDINLKIFVKYNLFVSKIYSKFLQEGMPIRLQQIHVVNVPSFFDKIYALVKPLLSQELKSKIHLHTSNSETLYEYLSKEDLPKDYGGTNGNMEEHMKNIVDNIMKKRNILTNDNLWSVNDEKLKNKEISDDDNNSSLKTLIID